MEPRDRTFSEVVRWRRSVRSFTGEVLSRELVREIVEEAHLAPSSMNTQPWRFVAVQGEALARFADALGGNAPKVEAAGTMVVVLVDTGVLDRDERAGGFYDGSPTRSRGEYAARNGALAAMTLLLSAASHGVGSLPMIGFDATALAAAAEVPEEWVPVLAVALGWPGEDAPAGDHDRLPLDDVLTFVA